MNSKLAFVLAAILCSGAGKPTDVLSASPSDPNPFTGRITLNISQSAPATATVSYTAFVAADEYAAEPHAKAQNIPAPGGYRALPYTLRVFVPGGSIRDITVIAPPKDKEYSGKIFSPPTKLVPYPPPR